MRFNTLFLLAGAGALASAAPVAPDEADVTVKGFRNATIRNSIGNKATCIAGYIPVTATTSGNMKLDIQLPINQSSLTELFVELDQVQSPLIKSINKGPATVSGTFDIYSELCFPKSGGSNKTVQILTHGVGFGIRYWQIPGIYSYVDTAAEAGYPTFSYDRLGVGKSARPDPIQVIQISMQESILEQLITGLRAGAYAGLAFGNVVGVGHSFGSQLTQGITAKYPTALDAAVLTGFTATKGVGQLEFFSALTWELAALNSPKRFGHLSSGFITPGTLPSLQFAFFRAPNYPEVTLADALLTKDTTTIGELFSASVVNGPANFTGPVDVVDGENDLPFCQGNCLVPHNQAAAVLKALYPHAKHSSAYYIAAGAGHGLNAHYSAPAAYQQIMKFVKGNGL